MLSERATILRYTYMSCVIIYVLGNLRAKHSVWRGILVTA
jgi:hypothetical protein